MSCKVCRHFIGCKVIEIFHVLRVDPIKFINYCVPVSKYSSPHGHMRVFVSGDREVEDNLIDQSFTTFRDFSKIPTFCKFSKPPTVQSMFEIDEFGPLTRTRRFMMRNLVRKNALLFLSGFEQEMAKFDVTADTMVRFGTVLTVLNQLRVTSEERNVDLRDRKKRIKKFDSIAQRFERYSWAPNADGTKTVS